MENQGALQNVLQLTDIAPPAVRLQLFQSVRTEARTGQIKLLRDLCDTMLNGSLCAMGGMTPYPVLSALNHYPEDFGAENPDRQAA